MTKSLDVLERIEKANTIRKDAEKEARKIESGILKELKVEKRSLLKKVELVEREIARITGEPAAEPTEKRGKKKKRIDATDTILAIVKAKEKISCIDIEKHPDMVAEYKPRKVPAQALKLGRMVKEKKLVKSGKHKKAVYSLP